MEPGSALVHEQRPDRDSDRGHAPPFAGGNLVWSLIAIVAGVLVGTFFMTFHSLAAVVALVGHDLIHRVERWLTIGFFGVLTVTVLTLSYPAGSFDLDGFKATPFLIQFGAVAGYQISRAIYVSDYSRDLPPDVTVRKTLFWTYWGSAPGAIWLTLRRPGASHRENFLANFEDFLLLVLSLFIPWTAVNLADDEGS